MKLNFVALVVDSVAPIESTAHDTNWWMIMALIELLVIIILLLMRCKPHDDAAKRTAKEEVLNTGNIDFGNTINSAFHAQELYKKLIVKCHPDRFAPDEEKMAIANELSAKIVENKNNVKQLKNLQDEAIEKLGIKFN